MSERPHVHMVYLPTELWLGLMKKIGSLEIGQSSAILDCVNECLYREGFISEEVYQKFRERYRRKIVDVVHEKEKPIEVEVNSARLEVQKSKISVKRHVDYSKFSDEELLEAYRRAWLSNDVVEPQLIQGEANKRGYRFKADDNGNIRVIALDKTLSPLKVGRECQEAV